MLDAIDQDTEPQGHEMDVDPSDYPVSAGLRVSAASGRTTGVDARMLRAGTILDIMTEHTRYHFVMAGGGEAKAMIQGGSYFPEPTAVRIAGSSIGSSVLKIDWIALGQSLELFAGTRRIVTSRVRAIRVDTAQ
ncbi:MAG TPA: hypothetical protein VL309_11925 [Vicinamibacterales bacterium]|jgi:hypothetical protein|nr:hypothetical protein [Vicinamibacterales bacterium]